MHCTPINFAATLRASILCSLLCASLATAAAAPAAAEKPQAITLAPYAWLPNLTGSVGIGGLNVPLQLRATQLFSDVQAGGMGYCRWQKGDRFIYLDGIFIDFSAKSFGPFFGQSVLAGLRFGELGVGMQRRVGVLGQESVLALYGGAHYTRIRASVTGEFLNAASVDRWIDPVIGMVWEMPLAGRLSLTAKVDGAGFGVTRNHYYSGLAVLEYRISRRAALAAGYRWSSAHYVSSDGLGFTLEGQGPMLGLRYILLR